MHRLWNKHLAFVTKPYRAIVHQPTNNMTVVRDIPSIFGFHTYFTIQLHMFVFLTQKPYTSNCLLIVVATIVYIAGYRSVDS